MARKDVPCEVAGRVYRAVTDEVVTGRGGEVYSVRPLPGFRCSCITEAEATKRCIRSPVDVGSRAMAVGDDVLDGSGKVFWTLARSCESTSTSLFETNTVRVSSEHAAQILPTSSRRRTSPLLGE